MFSQIIQNIKLAPHWLGLTGADFHIRLGGEVDNFLDDLRVVAYQHRYKYTLYVIGIIGLPIAVKLIPKIWPSLRSRFGPGCYTILMETLSSSIDVDYRYDFKNMTTFGSVAHTNAKNHSHPEAAQLRCRANTFINAFIDKIGRNPYSHSLSPTEQKVSMDGDRSYYVAKDFMMGFQNTPFNRSRHVSKFTDVDYYVDLPSYCDGRYIILYSFVPKTPSGITTEGVFTTRKDGVTEVVINGGGRYEHELWDFDTDHFIVDHWWGSAIYLVEQRQMSDDRRVIYLNPVRRVYTPLAWLVSGRRLQRRQINHGPYNITEFVENGIRKYGIGAPSSMHTIILPEKVLHAVILRYKQSKTPQSSDTERLLRSYDVEDAVTAATQLFAFLNAGLEIKSFSIPITTCVPDPHSYQTLDPLVLEDGKASMRAVGHVHFDRGFAAVRSFNNDNSTVEGRINDPRARVKEACSYPPFYYQCVVEFNKLLIPEELAGTLVPYDYEYMYSKMTRPTQRALIERIKDTMFCDRSWFVKAFQKAESMPKITDPRNISTCPMEHNFRYGQYMKALGDVIFKKQHWYAFGKHPTATALQLHLKTINAEYLALSDYSKLDATVSDFFDDAWAGALNRSFPSEYAVEIQRLRKKETYAKAYTANGVHYDTGTSTLSGSSSTTLRNTYINALTSFITYRHSCESVEAYEKLGLYGGDDGNNPNIDVDMYQRVSKKLGLVLKLEVRKPGDYVGFLGRVFLDPWTTTESMADVPRQLGKLHLSGTPKTVPDEVILARKAEGMMITDSNTPILGAWAKQVLRFCPLTDRDRQRYDALTQRDVSYWTKYVDPYPPSENYHRMNHIVAEMFNIPASEVCAYQNRLLAANNYAEMDIGNIMPVVPEIQVPAVYRGEIHFPPKPKVHYCNHKKDEKGFCKECKPKQPTCNFTKRGETCPLGDTCVYSHVAPRTVTPPSVVAPVRPLPMCRFTERGRDCPRGATCGFSHVVPK